MLKQRFDGSNTVLLLCFLVVVSVVFVVVVVTFFVLLLLLQDSLLLPQVAGCLSVIFICFADGCASKLCDKGKYFLRYSPAETTLMS